MSVFLNGYLYADQMQNWFHQNPDILHVDSTYKINLENYVLCNFLVQNQRLKGLPVAFAYMRNETNVNFDFVYDKVFEVLDVSRVKIVMVDKDLQNLDLLRARIPNAELLICTFHVLKYLRTRIVGSDLKKVQKNSIKELVNAMVYASSQTEYEEFHSQQIRIDKGFADYWNKNWDGCRSDTAFKLLL